ncbi:unnamed protein product [Rangifer tarandus platyrhynchus]|uniref:Uncharacterized protein n=1 Tax=Rangifer tarandus platyrhynchus TaxID=3082113 RepID=A0AC59ZL82_RANTA
MLRTVLDASQRLLKKGRESWRLVLLVVFVALLLHNMLLTVVVTITPTYLYAIEFKDISGSLYLGSTTTSRPALTPTFPAIFSFFENNTVAIEESVPDGIARTSGISDHLPSSH